MRAGFIKAHNSVVCPTAPLWIPLEGLLYVRALNFSLRAAILTRSSKLTARRSEIAVVLGCKLRSGIGLALCHSISALEAIVEFDAIYP